MPADSLQSGAERGVFSLPVQRPIGITMVVLAVTVFGWVSLGQLPVNLLPELSYPTLTVRTEYAGAGPEDVEERISEKIQEAVAVLPGLENYTSISRAGLSDIVLEFAWGSNLSMLTSEIRERIDRALLPDDSEEPLILRYDPSLDPILRIGVTSARPLGDLRSLLEEEVERELEALGGVAAVRIRGGLERQISIELSEQLLALHRVDILTVATRLRQENVNLAAGRLLEGETEYLVRTLGELRNPEEIGNLIIAERGEEPVRLRDLGDVGEGSRERDVITRVNGRESVEIQVFQEAGANLVEVADTVKDFLLGTARQRAYLADLAAGRRPDPEPALREEERRREAAGIAEKEGSGLSAFGMGDRLQQLRRQVTEKRRMESFLVHRLPRDLEFRVLSDPSSFVKDSLSEVRSSALTGGALAVLVLFLFLRRLSATAIVALSIPLSVIATFAPFNFAGVTLNVMSLGGLALGIGMLVDNSIVVLESIARCREEGDDGRRAAVRGVREVGSAVTASTLTTVAVFLPIVFVQGVAGRIFRDQALAVVFSLVASLGVALFFIPTLAALGSRRRFRGGEGAGSDELRRTAAGSFRRAVGQRRSGEPRGALGRLLVGAALLVPFAVHWLFEKLGWLAQRVTSLIVRVLSVVLGGILGGIAWLLQGPAWVLEKALNGFRQVYAPLCRSAVHTAAGASLTVALGFALFAAALLQVDDLGTRLLPEVHQGELIAKVALAVNSPVEQTDRTAGLIAEESTGFAGVEWVSTAAGVARDEVAEADEGPHTCEITVHLTNAADLAAAEEQVLSSLEPMLGRYPEVTTQRIERPELFRVRAPLQVEVHGTDLEAIRLYTREVQRRLGELPFLHEIKTNLARGSSEVLIQFDRDALHRRGLLLSDVAERLRSKVQGAVPTYFTASEQKIDILVRIDRADLKSLEALKQTSVSGAIGSPVALGTVARLTVAEGPAEIRQVRGDRVGVVSARVRGFDLGGAAGRIQDALADLRLPEGMFWELGGQARDAGDALRSLYRALALAVFLVYIVMAAQFESLVQPLIILGTIPLATVGVIFTLAALGTPISVVVLIGVILLAGIVVNNAILLVDAINRRRAEGLATTDAIVRGCLVRLRPILMTAGTTVLGLLPLTGLLAELPGANALPVSLGAGEAAELRAPMAITVIAGLLSSTALTLLVIPAAYALVDRAAAALGRLTSRRGGADAGA